MNRSRAIGAFAGVTVILAAVLIARAIESPRLAFGVHRSDLLGATLEQVQTPGGPMLIVTSLKSDGAASVGGLEVGDQIDRVNGRYATSLDTLRHDLLRAKEKVFDLRVWRHGRPSEIKVNGPSGG